MDCSPQRKFLRNAFNAQLNISLPSRAHLIIDKKRRHERRFFCASCSPTYLSRFPIGGYVDRKLREITMTKSRSVILSLLLALAAVWTVTSARAEPAFQRFTPLFIELDGWQGQKPDGVSMDMPNG